MVEVFYNSPTLKMTRRDTLKDNIIQTYLRLCPGKGRGGGGAWRMVVTALITGQRKMIEKV